jgi:GAF domain-containing protein
MNALLLLSMALVLVALARSIALWIRTGESRAGLLGALFFLIAFHGGVGIRSRWDTPFVLDISALGAFAVLAAGVFGILIVAALRRTLAERDRVETLHWDSMETVRVINELASNEEITLDDKIARLLEIGTSGYGLEVGMVARVKKDRYEVIAIRCPDGFPVAPGAAFSLGNTFCGNTLNSERPIGIERITDASWTGRLERAAFGFNSYLGASVRVDGSAYGTISFASSEPRNDRFTATDKDLIRLMAQWLGSAIERSERAEARPDASVAPSAPAPPARAEPLAAAATRSEAAEAEIRAMQIQAKRRPTRAASLPGRNGSQRVIDPNQILLRIESELHCLAGDPVKLALKLEPELGVAAAPRVPLGAIVRTLVMNALDSMPGGGELSVETSTLELATGEPGVIPAVAPARYVTISVTDSGSEPDEDTLSRLFDPPPVDAAQSIYKGDRLVLSTVYRILQACGGDLSVDVKPGIGSTFTVYLPRAGVEARALRKTPPARTPVPPSPNLH